MQLSTSESSALACLFGLLAEDMAEHEVRERVGRALLNLLRADYYASFVWDDSQRRFGGCVTINMNPATLRSYDEYFQFNDPITFELQARRVPTLVTQVMPQRELMRTEFYNDFLARDGLHWGVNLYSYRGGRNIGDMRIWRGRRRENFDARALEMLRLIEPAFGAALQRAALRRPRAPAGAERSDALSPRELCVARMVGAGLTDKQIARQLGVEASTVRTYLMRCCDKLQVHRRGAIAAAIARRGEG
ncbi:MAG TPA: LuxR C-terminal-related transcriptional regulator [Burkholderiaceae bacterium]|jgi:DNA-binding CsgD family transcriptional regulator|nr:LuxR C-terminal-related transcriptional regulator [Burkholderiaceae bacterium]